MSACDECGGPSDGEVLCYHCHEVAHVDGPYPVALWCLSDDEWHDSGERFASVRIAERYADHEVGVAWRLVFVAE